MGVDEQAPITSFGSGRCPAANWAASIQIGEALWRARQRKGLTIQEVARRAGTTSQIVRAIEDSAFERMPSRQAVIATALAYAGVVDLPRNWVALTLSRMLAQRAINIPIL